MSLRTASRKSVHRPAPPSHLATNPTRLSTRTSRRTTSDRSHRSARAKKAKRLVSPSGVIYRNLSDVEPKEIPWLWPSRIPRGMLTLIIGDPDEGKSYMTLDLSARVSTGG